MPLGRESGDDLSTKFGPLRVCWVPFVQLLTAAYRSVVDRPLSVNSQRLDPKSVAGRGYASQGRLQESTGRLGMHKARAEGYTGY